MLAILNKGGTKMILCNFNINNLFVRYKFGHSYPGDRTGKSTTENKDFGYLPLYQKGSFEIFNETQRKLAVLALTQGGSIYPDVICFQEVESIIALRGFNEQFLNSAYQHTLVIDSRDFRQIDVGILSKYPIIGIRSYMDDKTGEDYIFSRDFLEVTLQTKKKNELTFFINHFKSKLVSGKTKEERQKASNQASAKRELQAKTVSKIIKDRFPDSSFDKKYFAVLGDLNDTPSAQELAPLVKKSNLIDAFSEGKIDKIDRWTHYYKSEGTISQLDHVLLSPALAKKLKKVEIERRGIGFRSISKKDGNILLPRNVKLIQFDDDLSPLFVDFQFERFDEISVENIASDHCPVFLKLDID